MIILVATRLLHSLQPSQSTNVSFFFSLLLASRSGWLTLLNLDHRYAHWRSTFRLPPSRVQRSFRRIFQPLETYQNPYRRKTVHLFDMSESFRQEWSIEEARKGSREEKQEGEEGGNHVELPILYFFRFVSRKKLIWFIQGESWWPIITTDDVNRYSREIVRRASSIQTKKDDMVWKRENKRY